MPPDEKLNLIGELLIQKGLITIESLERALAQQEHSRKRIGDILIESGLVDSNDFYEILSQKIGVGYVKLKNISIEPAVIKIIPADFARYHELIPVDFTNNTITIAMADPLDVHTIDNMRLLLKKDIKTKLATKKDILEAIEKYYG